jgi:hypothetical protein
LANRRRELGVRLALVEGVDQRVDLARGVLPPELLVDEAGIVERIRDDDLDALVGFTLVGLAQLVVGLPFALRTLGLTEREATRQVSAGEQSFELDPLAVAEALDQPADGLERRMPSTWWVGRRGRGWV